MNRMTWMILLAFLINILVDSAECDVKTNRTYVKTPLGTVQGYYERSWKNRPYKSFTGIPFAKPPVGSLRFEPPVPLTKWDKTIEATVPTPICIQYKVFKKVIVGEEDCLYLNIHVPVVNNAESVTLPVLFFIHGGAFQLGTSSKLKAKYLMDRDMIFITINYRLGAFGFLSTGDHVIPGNMGLKDQSLALRWVSENIKYFGGDPNQITLAGDSAGGASVHYHYLSPMSAGLFQNGISFSGCALDPWTFKADITDKTRDLASALNCPLDSTAMISQCLKTKPIIEILQSTQDMVKGISSFGMVFLPVVENIETDYFINSAPIDIITSGKVSDVPWTTGFVKDEGLLMTVGMYRDDELAANINENWEAFGGDLLFFDLHIPKSKWAYLLKAARKHYLGSKPINKDRNSMNKLTHLVGDYIMSIYAQRAAKLHAEVTKSPIYFYYYTYGAAMCILGLDPKTGRNFGVGHDDDAAFVLESNGMNPTTTENDREMLDVMLDNWYSIVATRKPNLGVPWLDVGSSADFQYMHIAGPENNRMVTDNNLSEIQFWTSIGL